ncbi:MAG: hypothetical protein HZC41_22685 [Chloroflexi bacterium]|nr:hypothetical protein [Chloroflexota bacterium]
MMRRTIITTLLLLIFSIISTAGAQDNPARIWVSAPTQQAAAGDEVVVSVNVSGAAGIYGSSFKLAYDPQALEVVASDDGPVTVGSFFGDAPNFPLANTAADGMIEYAMTLVQPAEPISGDGVLGTVTFRALQDAPVTVTPVEASLVAPEFTEVNGRKVAQSMNTITPEITGQTDALTTSPELISAEPDISSDPGVSTASVAAALAENRQTGITSADAAPPLMLQPVPSITSSSTNPAIMLAGLLFMVGVGLLVVSVGMYTRMRGMNLLSE